ncbi:MAG: hypothetical protein Kapaf2KO_22440 [Candidatus Kapaibacteriales bacterium]
MKSTNNYNKTIKNLFFTVLVFAFTMPAMAGKMLIPMDLTQTDHLKSYGYIYWILGENQDVDWLLNYRGGAFMHDFKEDFATECRVRGIDYELVEDGEAASILAQIKSEDVNQDVVKLEKQPKIAVYAPPSGKNSQPWDDAVRIALDYAEIEHELIWDKEIINGELSKYDWVHLHHEDFTGQYGKFYANYRNAPWYIDQVNMNESLALELGFSKVSEMKKAVVLKLREFIAGGGFQFAMCSGTDTYDIALAVMEVDIAASVYDGDAADPLMNQKLNYDNTFAFKDFSIVTDPYEYEYSTIDVDPREFLDESSDYFTLFEFSAKYDPVPTMLTQCHVNLVKGFMGQTTAFRKQYLKPSVTILGIREGTDQVRYIHGSFGRGTWTWYAGHDPEDYRHAVGDPTTDLSLHRRSPGYRLILNNVLFPAAKKKKQKT